MVRNRNAGRPGVAPIQLRAAALLRAVACAASPVLAAAGTLATLSPLAAPPSGPGRLAAQAIPPEPAPIAAGRAAPPGRYGDLDVIHYEVRIDLPQPGGSGIEGLATLTLRPARPGLGEAVLDFTGLAVLGVEVDGVPVDVHHRDGLLHVPLPPGSGPADTLQVRIGYLGTPDDGLVLGRNLRGRPSAFVDNWPNRTRFWLPTADHPSDKATATLTVTAPASWLVVANGGLLGEPEPASPAPDGSPRRAWRWGTQVPLSTYNLVFGAAEMEVKPLGLAACGAAPASPRPDGCVEVTAWLFSEDTAQASLSFRRAAEMVDFYTELVGPYPFEKLAHVQSSTRFGGMENASAIFYSERALAAGLDIEGTVAHETAHQWFGDHVTQADWPELWLSEGFATYFGHLWTEHGEGSAALGRLMEEDRRQLLASPALRRPVIDRAEPDLFALLNDNNYAKGGWVLHMLRGMVGDERFFAGVRRYYAGLAGRTATTADFQAVLEAESGRELGWFFEQWLEGPGIPRLAAEHAWDGNAREAVVTLRQLQPAEWPAFRLLLELEVVGREGEAVRHRVELTEREQSFRLPAAAPPTSVRVDPDGWVLWEDAGRR